MGGALHIFGKAYEAVTGDDKYEDLWRKPISGLFGGDKKAPAPVAPGPDPAADAKAQADREEEMRKKLRLSERGRASTILTGSSGLSTFAGGASRRALFGE